MAAGQAGPVEWRHPARQRPWGTTLNPR